MRSKNPIGFLVCAIFVFGIQSVIAADADIVFILDQSGSMDLPDNGGIAYVSGKDTLYYQSNAGCTNTGTNGIMTIQPRTGTAISVSRLVSNTGCASPVGDPFKVRALAVSQGIDYIASLSANSTVGYVPFATTIVPQVAPVGVGAGPQRPLTLTTGNITLLKSRAIIDPTGGSTNYDIPLDSAKTWLNNRAITPSLTNKKAIIFITDGAPNPPQNDGFAKLNGVFIHIDKNIPIYGIFISAPLSDTTKLKHLSDSTGGAFYRVAPQQPDSLISTVDRIIVRILGTSTSIYRQNTTPAMLRESDEKWRWFDLRGRTLNGLSGKVTPVLPVEIRLKTNPN